MRRAALLGAALLAAACLATAAPAQAAEAERTMAREEIEAWLDARAVAETRDVSDVQAPPDAPPPAPRRRGLTLMGSVGALGHAGPLRRVSPPGPWFHLLVGYEPFGWLTVLVEGDISFSDTSRAEPPPDPRGYALYGIGAGLRFTLRPSARIGVYAEGTIGGASVTEDILASYGFRQADEMNPYFGARLGLEWYQVNPHYALVWHAGIRSYAQGLDRERSSETPLAWHGALAIRYTF